jgi:hypothetical protein
MSRSITMSFPHDLSVPDAKKRISERFDLMKSQYIDKVGQAELAWVGDIAHLRASALGQTATCEIAVEPATVRVEIHLPWLLAAMAGKVERLLQTNASQTLRLGTTRKA